MLSLKNTSFGYGPITICQKINLEIKSGEIVCLLGRNGMGKTTTIRTIFGLTRLTAGRIEVDGADVSDQSTHCIARAGLGLVPEGRAIFRDLSVRENIAIAIRNDGISHGDWSIDAILDLFPRLRERLGNMGNELSGGEQQMLAIGRALATNPRLLILDEATEGLAPLVRQEIWQVISWIRERGIATLIVDKDLGTLLDIADQCVILERGCVAYADTAKALAAAPDIHHLLLGV